VLQCGDIHIYQLWHAAGGGGGNVLDI
jgi:hypothetical protein